MRYRKKPVVKEAFNKAVDRLIRLAKLKPISDKELAIKTIANLDLEDFQNYSKAFKAGFRAAEAHHGIKGNE